MKILLQLPPQSFPVCPIFMAMFKSCDVHICVCACLHAAHIALTSLTQLLMSVLWWAFGKVSSSSSWTLSVSQQPLFISVTRMSATPPEPARISHGVELPMPLCIRCRKDTMFKLVDKLPHFHSKWNINRELYWSVFAVVYNLFGYGSIYANKSVALTCFQAKEITFVRTDKQKEIICFSVWLWPAPSWHGTTKIWFRA